MLVTLNNLNIEFIDDLDELERLIDEYSKLELAIEESVHYKLLAGKTQTLGKGKGVVKERSRFRHTNNIAGMVAIPIVRKIFSRIIEENPQIVSSEELKTKFELNRELMIRKAVCMAKAHDIGHVAFGHEGERAINNYFGRLGAEEVRAILAEHRKYFGDEYETEQGHISREYTKHARPSKGVSFEHNELGAILFNQIIEKNDINLPKKEIEDMTLGILAHSTSRVRKYELINKNLPAQIVRVGDKVEYINSDYDELRRLMKTDSSIRQEFDYSRNIIDYLDLPLRERINRTNEELVEEAIRIGRIWESEPVMTGLKKIRKVYENAIFLYDSSYSYHLIKDELFPLLDKPEELKKYYEEHPGVDVFFPEEIVRDIYNKVMDIDRRTATGEAPSLEEDEIEEDIWKETQPFKSVLQGENSERIYSIYTKVLEYYHKHPEEIPSKITVKSSPIDYIPSQEIEYSLNSNYTTDIQKALEYVSLLDDQAMMDEYKKLVELRIEKGPGYGIEPVTVDDMQNAINKSYKASVNKYRLEISKGDLDRYTFDEAERIYIQKGNDFYGKKLTSLGQEIYQEYYAKRFAEYAEDQELQRRMEEEDRRLGRKVKTYEDEELFEEVTDIEKSPLGKTDGDKKPSTVKITPETQKRVAETISQPVVPLKKEGSKYSGKYTGKKSQRESQTREKPKNPVARAVGKAVGKIGILFLGISEDIEKKEEEADIRREAAAKRAKQLADKRREQNPSNEPKKPTSPHDGNGEGHDNR